MDELRESATKCDDNQGGGIPDALLTPGEVAAMLRVQEVTLASWRCGARRKALPFVSIGGRLVRYRPEDVARFVTEHLCTE